MNNRENLKNALTMNYLKGNKNVYRISSPNKKHHVLVNKNSLFQLVKSRRIPTKKNLDDLVAKIFAGRTNKKANLVYHGHFYNHPMYSNWQYNGSVTPMNKYVFKTRQGNYGIQNVRNPVGYTNKLMLKNVNKNTLSKANMRTLRSLRRQNVKKAANFKRTFNEKQAQRRAYLVTLKNNKKNKNNNNNNNNNNNQFTNYWLNNNAKNIHVNPDNWVQTNNYNKYLVNSMRDFFNGAPVKVFKLKMKRG
jgi:hypothetical protein